MADNIFTCSVVNNIVIFGVADSSSDVYIESIKRQILDEDGYEYENLTIYDHLITEETNGTKQFFDFTCCNNIKYKYTLYSNNYSESHDAILHYDDIVLSSQHPAFYKLDDIIYTSGSIEIKYNINITNYKKNITESITPTLGNRYPVVRRNGDTNYTTFSLSGLITSATDNEYFYYNSKNQTISPVVKEYFYRQLIIDFLTDGQVKLFRSSNEGLMIVRLTDASFNPEQRLGRLFYNFSVNVTEIAEATVENLTKYGFLSSTEYQPFLVKEIDSAEANIPFITNNKTFLVKGSKIGE